MYVCKYNVKKECTNAFISMYKDCAECILNEIRHEVYRLPNDNPSYWNKCDVIEREKVLEIIDTKLEEVSCRAKMEVGNKTK